MEVLFEREVLAQVFYFHTSLTHLSGKKYCLSLATRDSFHLAYNEDSQFTHQNAVGGKGREEPHITSINWFFYNRFSVVRLLIEKNSEDRN